VAPSLPSFSVVVPPSRRPRSLPRCLAALTRLDYPPPLLEILVVDDGGGADVSAAQGREVSLTVLEGAPAGAAAARNRGAEAARGQLVAFTDDDCEPAPGWLHALAAALRADPAAAVGGRTVNALRHDPYAAATQLLVDFLVADSSGPGAGETRFLPSSNLAVDRERFLEVGGFDARFAGAGGEDREFCARWLDRGGRLLLVEDAVVDHRHELTLARYWRQHYAYGRGAFGFHRSRPRPAAGSGPLPERLAFYRDLVGYPYARERQDRRALLSLLLAVSQVATAAGYAREALAGRRREA
jgi:GT2 family glycosyltransferase